MKAIVLALAAALAACGPAHTGPTEPPGQPPPRTTEPADNCVTADDCQLVDACCGCNAGGRKISIRKDAVAGFEASRAERCGGQMCAQNISQDPSCDAEPICGSGNRCRVAPHMGH